MGENNKLERLLMFEQTFWYQTMNILGKRDILWLEIFLFELPIQL